MSQLELRFLRYQRVDDEQWSGAGRVALMDLMFAHNGALIWNLSSPLLLGIRVPKMIESRVNQTRSGFDWDTVFPFGQDAAARGRPLMASALAVCLKASCLRIVLLIIQSPKVAHATSSSSQRD